MTTAVRARGQQPAPTAGIGYSLSRNFGPAEHGHSVERPRAYAYLREHLLVCASEVSRTKQHLTAFASTSNLELAATFVEEETRSPAAFGRLFDAVVRDQVQVVLVPSMLHLMVLGSPRTIREYFEAAAGVRVLAAYSSS